MGALLERPRVVAPITRSLSSVKGTQVFFPYTSDVEVSSTFLRFFAAMLSSNSVQRTFVSIVRTGASTMSFTPTAAAR